MQGNRTLSQDLARKFRLVIARTESLRLEATAGGLRRRNAILANRELFEQTTQAARRASSRLNVLVSATRQATAGKMGAGIPPHQHVPGRRPRPAGIALTSPGKGLKQMKSFLTLAGIVFVAVLIEISLIYINKVRGGNLGFTFSLKPTMEVF
jgi:hypothetical protein